MVGANLGLLGRGRQLIREAFAVTPLQAAAHGSRRAWRLRGAPVLVAVLCTLQCASSANAQQAGSRQSAPQPQAAGVPANTTVVPRSAGEPRNNPSLGEVTLVAFLTDEGQRIDQGLVWRAFQEQPGAAGTRPRIVGTWREASPSIKLAPGDYVVNVAFGRAHLTRRISVQAGTPTQQRFVLNVGGLRITARVANGEPAPERAVSYEIFSGETDQLGARARVMGGVRPGLIVRLNAGIYHIVSTYGDANASVRADINVEAGKLTEAAISHTGARVTFKLVTRAGGEAQTDAQWGVFNAQGEPVKESVGALPTHILAPGAYVVTAKHSGRSFRRDFTVRPGETTQVEVVMQ